MKGFQNTHFYVAEIPLRKQNKYNAHIHHINCHIREICAKMSNADYLPTPVKKQHFYRGGIHLNEEGQQILTSAMAEVLNNHSIHGQCFSIKNNRHSDITDVNRVINNDQVSKIRVLSWNINGLGNKMTNHELSTFIRNYDIIF